MALIIEDGTGLSTANSYISVADADSYVAGTTADTLWTAASESEKEAALRLATQYIDLEYGSRFKGTKKLRANALQWPRYSADDGTECILDTEIPAEVKKANVEAAIRVIAGDDLLAVQKSPGTIKSEKKKLAVMEKQVEYMGGKSQVPSYPKIIALLMPLLKPTNMMQRG